MPLHHSLGFPLEGGLLTPMTLPWIRWPDRLETRHYARCLNIPIDTNYTQNYAGIIGSGLVLITIYTLNSS